MKQPVVAVLFSGLALSAMSQEGASRIEAVAVTKIEALRTDGGFVLGPTVVRDGNTISRGEIAVPAFDQLSTLTHCGSGELYPQAGVVQSAVEDVVAASGTESATISSFSLAGKRLLCDGGTGSTSEVFQLVVLSWEVVDNYPDLDGSDGFDTDGDGLVLPYDMNDTDGDTFIDEFNGGLLLSFADVDSNGDTVITAEDELLSSGATSYMVYAASGLDTFGVPMPSGVDRYDGSGGGPDGRPDGGIQVMMTRGFGGDGNGPLFGGLYPATNSVMMFGTTAGFDPTLCLFQNDLGQGTSNGVLWAEGMSECGADAGWSDGSASPAADDQFDPLVDVRDLNGVLSPPEPESIGIAMRIEVTNLIYLRDCCDINGDGSCTPTDFSAWVHAYQNSLPTCDTNEDGACTPRDFPDWLNAFNQSMSGNPINCVYR